jgi:hypothetical protein
MHFQATVPNWKEALLLLPDGAVFKAFDIGLLREAKTAWAAAGRDPAKLFTVFRHHDVDTAPAGTWAEAVTHARKMFARWVDGTFWAQEYWRYIDAVSEANEYASTTTWTDPDGGARVLQSMQAFGHVWNMDYRKRNELRHVRIALYAGTVANPWPRRVAEEIFELDAIFDYHAYWKCVGGQRVADDWPNHSGLWDRLEQLYGIKNIWLFGENMAYLGPQEGWRDPFCLGHDRAALVRTAREVWRLTRATAAYREGRIGGPMGCWFTTGRVPPWESYELGLDELKALALAAAEEMPDIRLPSLAPQPLPPPDWETDMENIDPARKARIFGHLDAIRAELQQVASVLYRVRVNRGVQVRDAEGRVVAPVAGDPLTGIIPAGAELDVYAEVALAPYGNRVVIHPDGRNVWADNVTRLP